MTAKVKLFTGSSLFVPGPWLEALSCPPHVRQCYVLVFAWVKADVPAMLTDRGISQGYADILAKNMGLVRHVAGATATLTEAGAVDATVPGIYAGSRVTKDSPVIRVEPDGSCVIAAHFRILERGGSLTVEIGA